MAKDLKTAVANTFESLQAGLKNAQSGANSVSNQIQGRATKRRSGIANDSSLNDLFRNIKRRLLIGRSNRAYDGFDNEDN